MQDEPKIASINLEDGRAFFYSPEQYSEAEAREAAIKSGFFVKEEK